MAFARPTLQEIATRIQNDISGQYGATSSTLRRAFTRVIARTYAGAVHLLYGYLDYIARQIMPDSAEDDELLRWAQIFGVARKQADFASGSVTITVPHNTTVPFGFRFVRSDEVAFQATSTQTFLAPGGTGTMLATIPVQAVEAGATANTDAGQTLTVSSPLPGMPGQATVASGGIIGGDDQESIEGLKTRLMLRIQQRPQGGALRDYEQWALEVPGVTRVWAYGPGDIVPTEGAFDPPIGQVYVYFARDLDAGSVFPSPAEVAEVQAYINARRPVTALVTVYATTPHTINLTINVDPFGDLGVQTAINAEIDDLFQREGSPRSTIPLSRLNEAISQARGEVDHEITVMNGGAPGDIVVPVGKIPVRGTVTYGVLL